MTRNVSRSVERHDESAVNTSAQGAATLVVGLGATGVATARYLAARGVDVTVIDSRPAPPGLDELRRLAPKCSLRSHRVVRRFRRRGVMLIYLTEYLTRFHSGFNVFGYLTPFYQRTGDCLRLGRRPVRDL